MPGYHFSDIPADVPKVRTRFRQINTRIPVPESLSILEDLAKYESRSMHGQLPVVWDRAEDFQVWDKFGNCWIDFTSTIFVANVGHANPHVKNTIRRVIDEDLLHSYTFATEIRARYLKKLIEFAPAQFEKAFLLSSGTEAMECAMKLMRLNGRAAGKRKGGIISFEESMHGRTMGAQMLGGTPAQREWIGYEDPNIYRLPFPYPWALWNENAGHLSGREKFQGDIEQLASLGVDFKKDICGFIMESYIGWGAVFYPKDYIQALVEFARANDILVAFDEIQGGFGRTGKLFAYQHYEVEPDLICCGKGMSSSLPLSAVLGRASIMDLPDVGSMSSTHSANPLSCAAGLANIEVIELQNLVSESERKGEILFSRLGEVQKQFRERVSYVLGKGLLAALILVDPATGKPDGDTASKVCERAMQKGLLVVHTGRESIKIGPPLTIPDAALLEGLDVLAESIEEIVTSCGG
jgi:4-aminobutyrate aminotransferase-like enzyme